MPADVRRHLGAQEGTRVDFVLGPEGQVTMRVVKPGLEALRGIVKPRVPVTAALIDQWAREARDHGFREE